MTITCYQDIIKIGCWVKFRSLFLQKRKVFDPEFKEQKDGNKENKKYQEKFWDCSSVLCLEWEVDPSGCHCHTTATPVEEGSQEK